LATTTSLNASSTVRQRRLEQRKTPGESRGVVLRKKLTLAALLAGLLLPALLSTLTGLLLLLARLLRAAALLLARFALAALLLARILLVRIVHNRSYCIFPATKTITTSLSSLQITSSRVNVTPKFCGVESVRFKP
jgi:hypothetical protein